MSRFPQLTALFTASGELPLQIRLFRLICAAAGFLCLAVILPVKVNPTSKPVKTSVPTRNKTR